MSSITDILERKEPQISGIMGVVNGLVMGTVVDNGNADFPGMVQVEFTAWTSGKNQCMWIPVLTGYGGAEYGLYVMPEIGDVVVMGFIGEGMKRPFVMGTLYGAASGYRNGSFQEQNYIKEFKTKGDNVISINDEDGKQSISITTTKDLTIKMEDETEVITVTDSGGTNFVKIDTKEGITAIEAAKKMTIKVGSVELAIDGQAGSVELKCKTYKVTSQQTVEIAGTQSTKVTGGMVTVEGSQTVKVSGATMTEIKGAMVKIN